MPLIRGGFDVHTAPPNEMEPITMQQLDMRNPGRPDHQRGIRPIHPLDPTLSRLQPSHTGRASTIFRNPPMDFTIGFTHATTKFSEVGNTVWVLWDQYFSIWETIGCAISMIAQPHLSDMSILQTEHRGIRSPHPPPLVFSRRQEPFS